MKNLNRISAPASINPDASTIECYIEFQLETLEKEGWDFDDYREAACLANNVPATRANMNLVDTSGQRIEIRIEGTRDELTVVYRQYSLFGDQSSSDWEDSGDAAQSIKDVQKLIREGRHTDMRDVSTNENDDYVETFAPTVKVVGELKNGFGEVYKSVNAQMTLGEVKSLIKEHGLTVKRDQTLTLQSQNGYFAVNGKEGFYL